VRDPTPAIYAIGPRSQLDAAVDKVTSAGFKAIVMRPGELYEGPTNACIRIEGVDGENLDGFSFVVHAEAALLGTDFRTDTYPVGDVSPGDCWET